MFLQIDNWLFDKIFQPFTDWFKDHTGRGPMWLACTCGYLIGVVTALKIALLPRDLLTVIDISFCIWTFWYFYGLEKRNPVIKAGTLNIRRYNSEHRSSRQLIGILTMFALIPTPLDVVFLLIFCQCLGFITSMYFGSCETKPPKPPKKEESSKLAYTSS